jgi:hypothetical protein
VICRLCLPTKFEFVINLTCERGDKFCYLMSFKIKNGTPHCRIWILRDFFDEKRFKKATDLGCPLRRDHILIEHTIDRFQRRRHVLSTHCLL